MLPDQDADFYDDGEVRMTFLNQKVPPHPEAEADWRNAKLSDPGIEVDPQVAHGVSIPVHRRQDLSSAALIGLESKAAATVAPVDVAEAAAEAAGGSGLSEATVAEGDLEKAEREKAERGKRVAMVVEHIRAESRAERLVESGVFSEPPFSLSEEQFDEVWDVIDTDDAYESIVSTVDEATGKEYLHDENTLSGAYAKILFRKQANNPKRLIVSMVRENSELWPKPTPIAFFSEYDVFAMTEDEVVVFAEDILTDEACSDIKPVTASNGAIYLYSDRYLEEAEALRLAEWVEVDMYKMENM